MLEKRFEVAHKEDILMQTKIIVDNVRGVNYLFIAEGNSGGLTPLLDKDRKIMITKLGRRQD